MGGGNTSKGFNFGNVLNIAGSTYSALQGQGEQRDASNYYSYIASQATSQSRDEQLKTNIDLSNLQQETNKLLSRQRAVAAANGVADAGSVYDVLKDTLTQEQMDEMAIRYNANMKSAEFDNQATMYKRASKNATRSSKTQMFTGLLTTASQVADTYSRWKQTSKGE